jgi:hypothetical protein
MATGTSPLPAFAERGYCRLAGRLKCFATDASKQTIADFRLAAQRGSDDLQIGAAIVRVQRLGVPHDDGELTVVKQQSW